MLADRLRMAATVKTLPPGQIEYTTPGTYTFVVPAGVSSFCAVAIGSGGESSYGTSSWHGRGGGGGGCGFVNNIPVGTGDTYTVVVAQAPGSLGADGNTSSIVGPNLFLYAYGGLGNAGGQTPQGGSYSGGNGGGIGGTGGNGAYDGWEGWYCGGGGGGAGGYNANGGNGANANQTSTIPANGSAASGAAGGGGGAGGQGYYFPEPPDPNLDFLRGGYLGGPGGGTALKGGNNVGQGGAGGAYPNSDFGNPGGVGGTLNGTGYGGGGAGAGRVLVFPPPPDPGYYFMHYFSAGTGAVRIIWGAGRSYPNNAADA